MNKKLSLANIQGKLNRLEMKNIVAGSGNTGWGSTTGFMCCNNSGACSACGQYNSEVYCSSGFLVNC